jgi:predicted RND superfamily exporter protein
VKATVGLLRQVVQDLLLLPAFQGLTVQGTGGYFLAAESERIIRRDLIWSINLAVILICVLIAWAFRRWGVLVYGQLPTLAGLFIALGAFALVRHQLNALTLGCSAALVGLGIDFTIHILTRCFAELGRGKTKQEAIQTAVRETGSALLLAAATTIAAFVAFLFSAHRFLQDMGLLAALGIVFCCLLSLMLLPALVACLPDRHGHPQPRSLGIPRLLALTLRAPALVLGVSLALCLGAVAALAWWPPGFETDLRNIHAADSPVLRVQTKIAAIFGGSQEPLTLLLEGSSEEQVVQAMQRLQPALDAMVEEGVLAAATSLGAILPDAETQEAVLQRLQHKDPETLAKVLATSLEEAGFDVMAFQDYIAGVRRALALQEPLALATLKAFGLRELLRPFLGHDAAGAAGLVVLFPKQELWTLAARQALSQRVTENLTQLGLHGTLAGLYTVSSEAAARVGADFRRITLLALVFVGAVICLRFRHPRRIGLVLLPVACGALWTAGFFALLGFKLNFMNIAILPMLLGIGIDDGIHIVHRFHTHGAQNVPEAMQFTGTAVCLTSLTTLLAFGTLALSVNQGIASVGVVTLIGITACLLASLFTLPAALKVWGEKKQENA